MEKMINLMLALITGLILIGCGATAKEIRAKSLSERSDVFHEVKEEGITPKGFVDVVIKASIKTHLERYYVLESKESLHGKPGYPFVLNIDGQSATWKVEGHEDIKPKYDEKGKAVPDPETGDGIKYVLEKKIRMTAGSHRIFFGLPEDDYALEANLVLKEDGSNTLEFKPVYKSERKYYSIRKSERMKRNETFLKGIKGFEIFLNGNPILF
jgi:hypothetical protein